MRILVKFRAGALQLTLFIAVVVALLLFSFLLFVQTHKRFAVQNDFVQETIENSNYGIIYALKNQMPLNDSISLKLNDEGYKSVLVYKDYWGVFEKVSSVAKIKNNRIEKTALIGSNQPEVERTALYLQENNKPLVLVGETKIQGVVYLPKQGVKPGNIAGHSFYDSQLIHGPIKSSASLPQISNELKSYLDNLDNANYIPSQFINLDRNREVINSFSEPAKVIFSNSDILLENTKLIGNIIIQSKSKITVDATTNLNEVILVAPEIEIRDFVKGKFQAIASEEIEVGKLVELAYPSALILNRKKEVAKVQSNETNLQGNTITIGKDSKVSGVIAYLGESLLNNFQVQLLIEEGTKIFGEVYCSQNMELKGEVNGTVYTNNFLARQAGSIYQNHLYNATITIDGLVEQYSGLLFNSGQKRIAKWLY